MQSLLDDLRYAVRMLCQSPGFAVAVVVTLALAIGVNTAMFSLVNTALLAPLPFEDAEHLVRVFRQDARTDETRFFSYPDYLEYRDRSEVFDELVAFCYLPVTMSSGETHESRFGQVVSGNFFTALGAKAYRGRLLTPEDNLAPGAHPVVILNHSYWQSDFAGDPSIVGKEVMLGDYPFTVVGIAPPGFAGPMPGLAPQLWAPIMMMGQIRPESRGEVENRDSGVFWAVGKLKPEFTVAEAQAQLAVTAAHLREVDAERYENESVALLPAVGMVPSTPGMRSAGTGLSLLVMSLAGLVLIVGCANVANLLLARSTRRRREIGIRLALGASRARLVRQLLTESMLLALLGGGAGLVLSAWTLDLLVTLLPELPFNVSLDLDFSIDRRVLAFAVVVSGLTGVAFGLFPALGATKVDPNAYIRSGADPRAGTLKRSRLRGGLIVAQVAGSLVLLVVAGLFGRSLLCAGGIDPGFEHERVLVTMFDLGAHEYDEQAGLSFCHSLVESARAIPGIEAASLESCPPLILVFSSTSFWIEGHGLGNPGQEGEDVGFSTVSEQNFRTLGMPLLRGRDFEEHDTAESLQVAIVNQAFVNRYWPGQDPLGKRLSLSGPEAPAREVVGVVATAKYWSLGEEPQPYVYLPHWQRPRTSVATLLVRTHGDPLMVVGSIERAVHQLNPNMALVNSKRLTDMMAFVLLPARSAALGFGVFGLLALALASVGVYGVMSYSVTQRTREIGIRAALGAQRGDIVRLVLRRAAVLTLIGVCLGLAISWASTRVLASLLYEIGTCDPLTFAGVTGLLLMISGLACYFPARRATKVDPMVALRCE